MFINDAAHHRVEVEIRGMLKGDGRHFSAVFFRKPETPDADGQPFRPAFLDKCLQQPAIDSKFSYHKLILNSSFSQVFLHQFGQVCKQLLHAAHGGLQAGEVEVAQVVVDGLRAVRPDVGQAVYGIHEVHVPA